MTLHITFLCPDFIYQVSDRLVSQGSTAWDKQSNKNVIFFASDGIATFAYTGTAFIDGRYTDEWIAENLASGNDLTEYKESFTWAWKNDRWPNLGLAVENLRVGLEKRLSAQPTGVRDSFFEVLITGWHFKRQSGLRMKVLPFVHFLRKYPGETNVRIGTPERYWYFTNPAFVRCTPSGYLSNTDNAGIWKAIQGFSTNPVPQLEELFVGAIRKVADRHTGVGKDCLSILLPRLAGQTLELKYIAQDPDSTETFIPWFLTRGFGFGPTRSEGSDLQMDTTPYPLKFWGNKRSLPMSMGRQERRSL